MADAVSLGIGFYVQAAVCAAIVAYVTVLYYQKRWKSSLHFGKWKCRLLFEMAKQNRLPRFGTGGWPLSVYQYIFGGSVWLRRRFCRRFTAAAFLRLRSVVGFS